MAELGYREDDPRKFLTDDDKKDLERWNRLAGIEEAKPVPPPVVWPPRLSKTATIRRGALVVSPTFLACIPGVVINGFAWWALLIWVLFTAAATMFVVHMEKNKRWNFEQEWIRRWEDQQRSVKRAEERERWNREQREQLRLAHDAKEKTEQEAKERAKLELEAVREETAIRDKAYVLEQLRPATEAEYHRWFQGFLHSGGVPSRRDPGKPRNYWTPKYSYLRLRPLYNEDALDIIVPQGCNLVFDNTGDHTGHNVLYIFSAGKYTTLTLNNTVGAIQVVHYTGEE
jgi:hypothetical protein